MVSKTSEADIWLSSYGHLTVVEGQQLSQRKSACFLLNKKEAKSACFLLNKKEALYELIQVNADEERNGGQAGRVYGWQL